MRILADQNRCIGAGQCALTAPDIFNSDEDGLVSVLLPEPGEERAADIREAVKLCPSRALKLGEDG